MHERKSGQISFVSLSGAKSLKRRRIFYKGSCESKLRSEFVPVRIPIWNRRAQIDIADLPSRSGAKKGDGPHVVGRNWRSGTGTDPQPGVILRLEPAGGVAARLSLSVPGIRGRIGASAPTERNV